jgi:hypothetical protein
MGRVRSGRYLEGEGLETAGVGRVTERIVTAARALTAASGTVTAAGDWDRRRREWWSTTQATVMRR